tara:strand:- start:50 stop:376 length:327 start_codon:yes stop_codon:yes gene_type:complete
MKKGKMTEVEVSCIKGMMADKVPSELMAKQLDRSVTAVQKEEGAITQQAIKDQMYIKSTKKGQGGVVVMTHAGSTQVDTNHDSASQKTTEEKTEKGRRGESIHKIYNK